MNQRQRSAIQEITTAAFDVPGLTPHVKLLLLVLAGTEDDTDIDMPWTVAYLAIRACCTPRAFRAGARVLEAAGLLQIIRDGDRSNVYRLNVDEINKRAAPIDRDRFINMGRD